MRNPLIILGVGLLTAALGPAAVYGAYSSNVWEQETVSNPGAGAAPLQTQLEAHVNEMIDAGYLQPAYYRIGFVGAYLLYGCPGETVHVLSDAYPLLTPATRMRVRTYLQGYLAAYPPLTRSFIHGNTTWGSVVLNSYGPRREYYPMHPTLAVNIWPPPDVPLETCYALWKYAAVTGDWAYVSSRLSALQTLYASYSAPATRYGQIMGLIGMARIYEHFGNSLSAEAASKAEAAFTASNFSAWLTTAQTNFVASGHDWAMPIFHSARMNSPVDTAWFCPEVGRFMHDAQAASVQSAFSPRIGATAAGHAQASYPGWFAFRSDLCYGEYIYKPGLTWIGAEFQAQGGENSYNPPDFAWTFFQVRAYVYQDSAAELAAMLDRPTCVGDLYHIQKLATAIRAYGTRTWTDVRAGTPSAPPAAPDTLTAEAVGNLGIALAWQDHANNESGFKIERKTGLAGTYAQIALVDANTTWYSDVTQTPATTFYYRVRATNSLGDSAYSNEAWASTPAAGMTPTLTPTRTATPVFSPTSSPTVSPTRTATPVFSPTPSPSASPTRTRTPVYSPTVSATPTPSRTPTRTATAVLSATATPTVSPSATASPTPAAPPRERLTTRVLSPGLADGINDRVRFGSEFVELRVMDLKGRECFAAQGTDLVWDGRTSDGRSCPSGQYLARLKRADGSILYQPIVLAK